MLKDDFGALIPGNGIPLSREITMRLLLYLCLSVFAIQLFFTGFSFKNDQKPRRDNRSFPGKVDSPRSI